MPALDHLRSRLRHVHQFVTRQGIATVGNLVYGLLCVRLLPVNDYAKFAIIFGFMGTLTVLTDTVTTGTIAPLVGERLQDRKLIADYVATVRHIVTFVFLAIAPVVTVVLLVALGRHEWTLRDNLQIAASILFISWFSRISGTYSTVLLLLRDRAFFYRIQIAGSLGSLALLCVAWAMHGLNLYVCVLLNCAQVVYQAISTYRRAQHLLRVDGHTNQAMQRQIIQLALPGVPGSIFYALQGQIMLMLLVALGRGTTSIANLGALGRLGQILTFFSLMNPVFVEPFFARLRQNQVLPRYVIAVVLAASALGLFCGTGFLFPQYYLLVLGPHYQNLRVEVGLIILSSSLAFLAGYMHTIHTSRRFVYWWNNISNIVAIVAIQAFCIWRFDLSVLRNLLVMNVVTVAVSLLIQVLTGIYGFVFGPQQMIGGHSQPVIENP